ncbi:biotin/lipoyl-containing protein, partial [Frankia sp. BMG5.23]|uniref:biotin/lipoyl-containing protein n=1 Tax=Frankia sp. BMG5.23 TaxID=683305 RepID=UPI0004619573
MTQRQFRLPDLGEGLTEADIVRWLAQVGDTVTVNQPLVEVETAKAVVEVPSPFAGILVETHGAEGTTLAVGAPLLTIQTADTDTYVDTGTNADGTGGNGTGANSLPTSRDAGSIERTPVLVGYGPRTAESRRRRPRRPPTPAGPVHTAGPV